VRPLWLVTRNSAASSDRRCVNYHHAGKRLAAPTTTAVCGVGGLRRLARICVCGLVRFGSGRNKFVQLLIRSWNSSGQFVRSLVKCNLPRSCFDGCVPRDCDTNVGHCAVRHCGVISCCLSTVTLTSTLPTQASRCLGCSDILSN